MRLVDLIKIDNRFEKSVNLLLDLHVQGKIDGYIPTRSSVKILDNYINEIRTFTGNRASVLIGPYGKGKSHLLLILLELLSQNCPMSVIDALIERIAAVNRDAAEHIKDTMSNFGPFLPVIINAGSGTLSQAFMRGLTNALVRDELGDVIPDNYYSEAIKMIQNWEEHFPSTFTAFKNRLPQGKSVTKFVSELSHYEESSLSFFKDIYPELSSGGVFNPIVDDEVVSIYRSVNRILREKHGYSGLYIIFDEFSKYVEGHTIEGFAEDMKVLQDMCELSAASRDEQLHITCVAHKSIRSYGTALPPEILNAFEGVSGRLKEVYFVVSSQNNYELISDAIGKKKAFAKWATENKHYQDVIAETYELKSFSSLFDLADYQHIVGEGCFPLTPVAAMLLLELSERIAQNERTIFTYITSKDANGLARIVEKSRTVDFVGVDSVFDYFVPLFRQDMQNGNHHKHEWLKADYALSQTENVEERVVIKTISILHMVNRPDDLPASERFIVLATGMPKENVSKAITRLEERKLLEFKSRTGTYEFRNNIGVDVELAIADTVKKNYHKVDICGTLGSILKDKYILPKKHNQMYCMTRYFNFKVMSFSQYMNMSSTAYLEWNNHPDGVIVLLLPSSDLDVAAVADHTAKLADPCLVVCLPHPIEPCDEQVRYLLAVRSLLKDIKFLEGNKAVKKELEGLEEDTIHELNKWVQKAYFPLDQVFGMNGAITAGPLGINRLVSDICDQAYYHTPIINHELINRHDVSAQIAKARTTIMTCMLNGGNTGNYETGTSAESTIYRAVMIHTQNDPGLIAARREMNIFFSGCVGNMVSFEPLIESLTKPPYGMRKGVLPIYLLDELLKLENLPVIYRNEVETPLNVETINSIVRKPSGSFLFIERETVQKSEYVRGLSELFSDYTEYCREVDRRNQLSKVVCQIQAWYRSLPQTAKTFSVPDKPDQNMQKLTAFRKLFAPDNINPRDVIMSHLPAIFDSSDYTEILRLVADTKNSIDSHIFVVRASAVSVIRNVFGADTCADLRQSLRTWYDALPEENKKRVYSDQADQLRQYLQELSTNDETEIAARIVRLVTGTFIEDWNEQSLVAFQKELENVVAEIAAKQDENPIGTQKLLLLDETGDQVERYFSFDPDELSSTGTFFKNALESMLEEYDGILDNNEKVGVLVEIIKQLMN